MSYNYADMYLEEAKSLFLEVTKLNNKPFVQPQNEKNAPIGTDRITSIKTQSNSQDPFLLNSRVKYSEKIHDSGRGLKTSFSSPSLTFNKILIDLNIDNIV